MSDISFDFPKAIYLLLALFPMLFGQWMLSRHRQFIKNSYAAVPTLQNLLIARVPVFLFTKIAGWSLMWALACFSLMGPFGNIRYASGPSLDDASISNHYIAHEVIFLVDTSASMGVTDGVDGKSRLTEAQEVMDDIVSQLKGQTASLYAFSSVLTPLVPPTVDYLFLRLLMRELHIDEGDIGGTRFAPILADLKKQVFSKPSSKRYTLLMLSDGGDTGLETLKGEELEKEKQNILNAISDSESLHLRLFTIGMGGLKPQTIPKVIFNDQPVLSGLEPDILKELAEKNRGNYYMAQEWTSWSLAKEIISQIGEDPLASTISSERHITKVSSQDQLVDLYYQIPLGLALLFYALTSILPNAKRL